MRVISAADVIRKLDLKPHPEGGHFRETFRDARMENGRAASTAIYFLLARGERSHWHRIDAVESWHYYAGSPLTLRIAHDGCSQHEVRLGADLLNGERPQAIVPADAWQTAETTGEWTLVGCTVAPAFEFAKFELAPKGWEP
jgi:predicted cupin superfamily sugar epimerase